MLLDISRLPKNKILCIDMKSFYASCECVDHGLDPFRVGMAKKRNFMLQHLHMSFIVNDH
ncbi:DNA-damage repair protein [Geobacillus stearothermophilus]|uniref:DNA-damage repair protein n=1 Tax=Geobacillus stearothermophilus TaxID=1422 RepID=A0A916NZY4_GEOSE|nr:putative DNA-damage repair protein [Geobacillus stearothermophilus]